MVGLASIRRCTLKRTFCLIVERVRCVRLLGRVDRCSNCRRHARTQRAGTYREIAPNQRIVYDNGFEIEGAGRMVHTITLEEKATRRC